jgi:hypothetical protein
MQDRTFPELERNLILNLPLFYTFWAINGPLEQSRLRRQMDQFKEAGLDGVVFHPRFYPNKPPYLGECFLAEVSAAILYAKSIGLRFWLYDEDGWPSGTVGGELLKLHPEVAQCWAELVTERPRQCIAEFEHDGARWYLAEKKGAGVDYLNPDLALHFLALTHERYRAGLVPEAFAYVETFFCDEPELGLGHAIDSLPPQGAIPWTPRLPELYRDRFGEDIVPLLPLLFFPGAGYREVRVRFRELQTDIFREAFLDPINDWCCAHGVRFTGHIKGEEHPLFQVPLVGSCHQVFQSMSLPGIDSLERYPSNHFFPRQVSSVARQFGNGRCMVEAFGGAGWGATPADMERYLLWLGKHGLTDFVLHLSQYRLDSAAMHDWPPSQPLHLTWKEVYPEVIARVRGELSKHPRPIADLLVIAPYRGIMAELEPWELLRTNIHNAETYPDTLAGRINRSFMALIEKLHRAGIRYELADERTLEEQGKLVDGEVHLGQCAYPQVLVAEECQLKEATATLFKNVTVTLDGVKGSANSQSFPEPFRLSPHVIPVEWSLDVHPSNCLLLECVPNAESSFTATFVSCLSPSDAARLELVFTDDIAMLTVNGEPLPLVSSEEGSRASIPRSAVRPSNTLNFQTTCKVDRPFVWIQGTFRVTSFTPFTNGPGETIKTDGPFTLQPISDLAGLDLIAGGFPFLRAPLSALATIELPHNIKSLRLDGVEADAVRLTVDDGNLGWTWRVDDEYRFAVSLPAGIHKLRIELIPNTYNSCGPHHYYGGDWFVVSPDQVKGVRNFADPDDAPALTHVKAWHFRRSQLPRRLYVSQSQIDVSCQPLDDTGY